MKVLPFKRLNIVQEIIDCLQDEKDEVVEALVIGKKKSGVRFSYMTFTENLPELIGYLEALKTDLTLDMISLAETSEE